MILVLQVLLIAFCVQGLVKFAVGFLVPYSTRIRRLASYYSRGGRIIGVYDTATLIVMAVLVVLLFLTELQYLSFITGIVVGMLTIQIFFHRFSRVLAQEKAPETPTPPRKLMSYAIQADPALAWREIIFMAGALHMGAVHAAHQLHVEPVGVARPEATTRDDARPQSYGADMHAEQMAEDFPVVSIDSSALAAARMLAEHGLPGIVVTDASGKPYAVLPASQVVRFIVPQYVQDDPALAGVLDESMADRASEKLGEQDRSRRVARAPPQRAVRPRG